MVMCALSMTLAAHAGGGAPSNTEHQVGIGDSVESIAKKYTGSEKHIDVIYQLNPHLTEVGLQIGDYLFVPDEQLTEEQTPESHEATNLPPSPLLSESETRVIPGVKYGLAHVYRPGGFKIVSAPVDKEQ